MVALSLKISTISDFDFIESTLNQPNLLLNKIFRLFTAFNGLILRA